MGAEACGEKVNCSPKVLVPAKVRARGVRTPEGAGLVNVVIDLYYKERVASWESVRNDGIVGVIHKATQGLMFEDPKYRDRRTTALQAGLLWGAYHFGTGADGSDQAKHFLRAARPDDSTLLALDLEPNPGGADMTLAQARDFVEAVQKETGRWPVVYGGHYLKELLEGTHGDDVLSRCPLWLAQYGPTPQLPPGWDEYTFWQYTDGQAGPEPHTVKGIGPCDRDTFNGTLEQLRALWSGGGNPHCKR